MTVSTAIAPPPLVIVNDLDVFWARIGPVEADSPLLVYPDAVLASTVSGQLLQPVTRRDPEVRQDFGGVEHGQLAPGSALRRPVEPPRPLPSPDGFGLLV